MKLTPHVSLIERLSRGRLTPLKGTKTTGIVSPWSDGKLDSLVWTDILGIDHAPVTRSEAMSVPAIAAARNRIVQLADRPLRGLDASGDVTPTLPWLFRTDVDETAWERTARILDDWIFYPWSLLLVAREGEIMAGTKFQQIADAQHVPYDRWAIDDEGRMTVDGNVIPEGGYLLLRGPFDGLLTVARDTIRAAKSLERAWATRVRNPTPTIILEEKEEGSFTKKEAKTYVKAVSDATRDPDGAVIFAPHKVNLRLEGDAAVNVLTEARNAVRIDIANYLNLNASALDGAKPQASLTYETQQTESQELQDRMAFWTAPLEYRLSQDDAVPSGVRVRFDFSQSTPAQTGTPTED